MHANHHQVERIKNEIGHGMQSESDLWVRYNRFEGIVIRITENCKRIALEQIVLAARAANGDWIKSEIETFYDNHVKNYPEQSKQAILDGQTVWPIATNVAIGTRALCHQMLSLSQAHVNAG